MFYEEEKNVLRCEECLKIPLIGLIYENYDLYIEYYCLDKHKEPYYKKMKYDEFIKNFTKIFTNKRCECGGLFEGKPFYYCRNCDKGKNFYCDNNSKIHKRNEPKHILIPLEKFDILCECHNDEFVSFCKSCKLNLCIKKKIKHNNHEKEDIIRLKIEDVENYEKNIKNTKIKLDEFILYLEKFKDKIQMDDKNSFKIQYINFIKKEIKLMEMILETYKMKTKQNNLNYQMIQNVKNNLAFKDNFNFFMKEYDDDNIFDINCELEEYFKDIEKNSPIKFSPLSIK